MNNVKLGNLIVNPLLCGLLLMFINSFLGGCSILDATRTEVVDGNQDSISDKNKLDELMRASIAGDAEAKFILAQHYLSYDDQKNLVKAEELLLELSSQGYMAPASRVIAIYLVQGRCESALAVYSDVTAGADEVPSFILDFDRDIRECFDRPIGKGDWQTRRPPEAH